MMKKMSNKKESEKNAVVFIAYMIGASYVNVKPECDSAILEKRLELYYHEIPEKKQLLFENICDNYMCKVLNELPERLWDMRSAVKINITNLPASGLSFDINFDTWEFTFTLSGTCSDKGRVEFSHAIHRYGVACQETGGSCL